ncbi:hypothetical protein [Listeria aquatica]
MIEMWSEASPNYYDELVAAKRFIEEKWKEAAATWMEIELTN